MNILPPDFSPDFLQVVSASSDTMAEPSSDALTQVTIK